MRISDWSSDVCSSDLKVREYIAVAKEMVDAGWTLHVLASTRLARAQTVTAVVVAVLACALTLLLVTVMLQRRARLVERIEYQRRASEALERRVAERTADPRRAQDDPDRKSTRLNSSHSCASRMPSSA